MFNKVFCEMPPSCRTWQNQELQTILCLFFFGKHRFGRHALISGRNSNLSTDSELAQNFTMTLFYDIFQNSKVLKKVAPSGPQMAP